MWESAPPGGYTAALRDAVRRIVDVDGGAQLDSAHSADSQTRSAGRSRVQTPNKLTKIYRAGPAGAGLGMGSTIE